MVVEPETPALKPGFQLGTGRGASRRDIVASAPVSFVGQSKTAQRILLSVAKPRKGNFLSQSSIECPSFCATTVPKTVVDSLHVWLDVHPDPAPEMPLFLSQRRGRPLSVSTVNNMIKRWCRAAELPGNYGSHTMRKTWGYHQRIRNNQPIPLLMAAYGHSTQAQTLDYLGIQDSEIQDLYGLEL